MAQDSNKLPETNYLLKNINNALFIDTDGNVVMRTSTDVGNVTISSVNVTNVGINSLGNVDISGTELPVTVVGNVNVTQGTDPWVVSGNVTATIPSGSEVQANFAATNLDAFGRLRISNPYTLFDTKSMYYDHHQFATNKVSAGNVAYSANSSTYSMTVTGSGDAIYRETYRTFSYQPGKSLLVLNTFSGNTATAGLTQRVGYFNDENGIFFEVDGTDINMVIRSSSAGSLTHERIEQASWNGDRLDGLGGANNPSGHTLHVDRAQIFWSDIEWLGVGSVRVGFVINGAFIVCHTFHHANQSGNTTTYMGTANLPCRYELISTGPAATMTQICSTVISEGGYIMDGRVSSIGHNFATPIDLSNDGSYVPLLSIRLKSTMPDAIIIPKTYSISVGSNDIYAWKLYRRAITSGGTWTDGGSNTAVEYNLAPTALVSGDLVDEGYIRSSNQSVSSPQNESLIFENQLFRDPFTNTRYEFVLMAATDGTNVDALASIQWIDVS